MSALKTESLFNEKEGYVVFGYIRENFDKKCWIDQITATIIQFYMIKGGSLYVCGKGQHGCLGIEKYKKTFCKKPELCPPFIDNNARKVSVSTYRTLVVDKAGDVWCSGLGGEGALGNGRTDNLYVLTKLTLGMRVIAVSAGVYHSLLLCEDGTVKGCGSNKYGQIGLGNLDKSLVPKTIETLIKYKVVQTSACEFYSAALTEDGILFCFGGNRYGQCGVVNENQEYIMTPSKVDLADEIEFVDCGPFHTLVISRKGLIYSFGSCNHGKLGHGDSENKYVPTLIDSLKEQRMRRCAAGEFHSLCIDEEGIIWSFGRNGEGQCGLSEDIKKQTTPTKNEWFIKNNIKAKECFAGPYSSSIIAFDGSLYVFGDNKNHQLGLDEARNHHTPKQLSMFDNMTVQSVSMGHYNTAIICS